MSKEANQILGIAEEEIAVRAYAKFEERGSVHGFDIQDWLEAERELVQEKVNEGFPHPGITEFIVGTATQED